MQSVACASVMPDRCGDDMGTSTGTAAGFTAAGRPRDGPQSAAWRFHRTLSDIRVGGTYGALRRKRLKTACAPDIPKSAMQAPRRCICRRSLHIACLRKPDGCAGWKRNGLTVNWMANGAVQPFFNPRAERQKKRAEYGPVSRGNFCLYARVALGCGRCNSLWEEWRSEKACVCMHVLRHRVRGERDLC